MVESLSHQLCGLAVEGLNYCGYFYFSSHLSVSQGYVRDILLNHVFVLANAWLILHIIIKLCYLQMVNIRMEIFVWWVVPISGKVEWKYTSLEHGALLLTLIGPVMMHKLSVASWGISNQVLNSFFVLVCLDHVNERCLYKDYSTLMDNITSAAGLYIAVIMISPHIHYLRTIIMGSSMGMYVWGKCPIHTEYNTPILCDVCT